MSTFPTAFWKKQPTEDSSEGISITWETGMVWSRGNNVHPDDVNIPQQFKTSFPFVVGAEGYEYGPFDYNSNNWQVGAGGTSEPYFGWYLSGGYDDGGENNLSSYHRDNPWEIGVSGLSLGANFEADWKTAYSKDAINKKDIYNPFVQSGNATGSFTLSSTKTLEVSCSGLGEDYNSENIYFGSQYRDSMELSVDSTLLLSGRSPEDNRDVLGLAAQGIPNYDMQQVKLYSGTDPSIINTTDSPKGEPRGSVSEAVSQETRRDGYTTVNGIGTGIRYGLTAGDYIIEINVSTVDGVYNSGAFYGFDFKFV
tara:strand:- start:225 stop:1154 length:930 start_codon:yes stop_codon:yes gene_type:complete